MLRDGDGKLVWAILDGSFEPLSLAEEVVAVEPRGPPLCSFEACGTFDRRAARALRDGASADLAPGERARLAGGVLALTDLVVARDDVCTDTPLVEVGWVYVSDQGG